MRPSKKQDNNERFTAIPKEVYRWIYSVGTGMTLREIRVMLFIFDYTYGFSRNSHRLTNGFISDGMGEDRSNVQKAISSLSKKGFIKVDNSKSNRTIHLCKKKYVVKGSKDDIVVNLTSVDEKGSNWGQSDHGSGVNLTPKKERERKKQKGSKKHDHRSSLEPLFLEKIMGYGFPELSFQHEISDGSKKKAFDFVCEERKLLIEVDGMTHDPKGSHSTPEGIEKDWYWSQLAISQGYTVLRFDRKDIESLDVVGALKSFFNDDPKFSHSKYLAKAVYNRRKRELDNEPLF